MSDHPVDKAEGASTGAQELLARARAGEACAYRSLKVAIDDFFLPDDARLDERMRSALETLLRGLVQTVTAEVAEHGARLLRARGEEAQASALIERSAGIYARLRASGMLRSDELMDELVARVRQEALGSALPMHAPDDPERPSLINRFVLHPDRILATAAMGVLIAENRRRAGPDVGQRTRTDLPMALHRRLMWWVAAALGEQAGDSLDGAAALDQALSDAAQRSLAAYDEEERPEAAAMRFAAAIDSRPDEWAELLVESLGDRRIVLFTALLAHALGVTYVQARALVLDPAGDRLWLALRALSLSREAIAQVGYALCEADPRRDLERFADELDAIMEISPEAARVALGSLRLNPEYRAAVQALARARGER